MNFKFDENQLINYLISFEEKFSRKKLSKSERRYIAEFVMMCSYFNN